MPSPHIVQSALLTYNTSTLVQALDLLIEAASDAPELLERDGFTYDLVDVARQVFMDAGNSMYKQASTSSLQVQIAERVAEDKQMISSWNTSDPDPVRITKFGTAIVGLLKDVDAILGTNQNFLLSTWIQDARSWSDDPAGQDFLEVSSTHQRIRKLIQAVPSS